MIIELFILRIKQFFHILSELGVIRSILLLGLLCFGILAMFIKLAEESYQEFIVGIVIFIIISIHLRRDDKEFIKIYSPNHKKVFFYEYFLLSIPLIASLIYYQLWYHILFNFLFLIIIPFLNIGRKESNLNTVFQKFIPKDNFEWKAGFRKYFIFIMMLWFIGLVSSFFLVGVPISIFFLSVIIISFYEKHESLQILIAGELKSTRFLTKKILSHLKLYFIIVSPLIISFTIFNHNYYYIPIIEFLLFSILIVYTILLKYAYYRAIDRSEAPRAYTMIGMTSIFLPVFIPVVIVLSVKFLFQASDNLKHYFNDFN